MNKVKLLLEGLVEISDYITVCDKEFESSLSFASNRKEFKGAFKESPEYFTDEVLISINHFLETGEILEYYEIIGDIEARIVGRGSIFKIEYGLKLVGNGYEWIDLSSKEQITIVGNNIRKILKK